MRTPDRNSGLAPRILLVTDNPDSDIDLWVLTPIPSSPSLFRIGAAMLPEVTRRQASAYCPSGIAERVQGPGYSYPF
jgi:hypothetical protein